MTGGQLPVAMIVAQVLELWQTASWLMGITIRRNLRLR